MEMEEASWGGTPDAESVCAPLFRIALLVLADSSLALAIRRQLRLLARVLIRSAGLALLSVVTVAFFSWCAVIAFAGTAQAREQQRHDQRKALAPDNVSAMDIAKIANAYGTVESRRITQLRRCT